VKRRKLFIFAIPLIGGLLTQLSAIEFRYSGDKCPDYPAVVAYQPLNSGFRLVGFGSGVTVTVYTRTSNCPTGEEMHFRPRDYNYPDRDTYPQVNSGGRVAD